MTARLPEELEPAVLALALDAATAEFVAHLDAVDIASVLLKGPATARWLYADDPDARRYGDIDLLVSPDHVARAGEVLESLGYTPAPQRAGPSWGHLHHGTNWERQGSPTVHVDLHRTFHGVEDDAAWWSHMDAHAQPLTVGGRRVRIPDAAGCALVIALHDTAFTRDAKSSDDLARGLETLSSDVWAEAARRAELADAVPSFVLALSRHPIGRDLIAQLGLPTAGPPEVWLLSSASTGRHDPRVRRAWSLAHGLSHSRGVRGRAHAVWEMVWPPADLIAESRPLARHRPWGLLLARLQRLAELMFHAPLLVWDVARGYWRARRSGWHR